MPSADIWRMGAGVAFFLLALHFMEESLRHLAGRRFKLFLKRNAKNKLSAIAGGAVVTSVLQSSSIVNLLLLSMVGAGVVKMENALALLLGSNLGSTTYNWLVALAGFGFSIETIVLPVTGICGILLFFLRTDKKIWQWCRLLFGISFLFVALGFIKSGMEGWVQQTDLSRFNQYPLFLFLLMGVGLTAVVQSSSATMALTLAALYANAISLHAAMALVLGAEIGTTLKLFIAAAGGPSVKKRVAMGNFLFNVITVLILFLLLKPAAGLLKDTLRIRDPLIALVFFQTCINLFSVLLFFPFLKQAGMLLQRWYPGHDEESLFISRVNASDTTLALEALEQETSLLIRRVTDFCVLSFHPGADTAYTETADKKFRSKGLTEKYALIKQMYGEMHAFCLKLLHHGLPVPEQERREQLIASIRNLMYAAKNIKDAQPDIEQTRNSSNDLKYGFYQATADKMIRFCSRISSICQQGAGNDQFDALTELYRGVTAGYEEAQSQLYRESLSNRVNEVEISTLINFNRQVYTTFKSMVFGLKDYLLNSRRADYFDALPGFIR